ncbi:MAG: LamG domain-containing protein [Proteobacteria bacterium]|nr:LamG domain-containing protein [Pseudomonadota bacterium]
MKQLFLPSTLALGWLLVGTLIQPAIADVAQVDQNAVLYSTNYQRGVNFSSFRGAPGKSTTTTPPPTDGRAPSGGTSNQFQGVITYGAVVLPKTNATLQTGKTFEQNAVNLNLPRGTVSGATTMVLRSSQAGAATFSQTVSFYFGSVIAPPSTDENGVLLTNTTPAQYWNPEPYTNGVFTSAGYYYSPNARQVFATVPGPVQVTWRKADSGTTSTNKVTIGGLDYALTNVAYVVSGAPVKPSRKLYWTEKSFSGTGKGVSVPAASVGVVNFVYNPALPQTVPTEYSDGYSAPGAGTTNTTLPELRTVWYDPGQGLILAYNAEGRVFMELLGDATPSGAREFLGYEIVDIFKQPVSQSLTNYLGEKIMAYANGQSDTDLLPSPLQSTLNTAFLYQDSSGSSGRTEYYSAALTQNPNDVLVYWLEAGVVGLRWPLIYNRYVQVWPEDPALYSHYLRPLVSSATNASLTAVQLSANNSPAIQYQDALDYARATLDESARFYTFLDASQPTHRTLLRFSSGTTIAFERVFSMLDSQIKPANPLAGTLDLSVPGPVPGRGSFLNLTSGGASLPAGLSFNSQAFTVESWVYLQTNFAQLFAFTAAGQLTTLNLTAQGNGPVMLASSSNKVALNSVLTLGQNFNNTLSRGGVVISFDFECNPNDSSQWVAVNLGLSSANQSVSVNDSSVHFGFLFRKNGQSQAFDGSTSLSNPSPAAWAATTQTNGHIDVVCSDPTDGNPFDGVGTTKIEVYVNNSATPLYTFTKGNGGYTNNYINFYPGISSGNANLNGYGVAGGSRSAPAGNVGVSVPLNQWAHVAMTGDAAHRELYLNGVSAGELPAAVAASGALNPGVIGSAGLALDEFRYWSVPLSASQVQAGMTVSYPAGTSGLELQYGFNEAGTLAYDTSGNSNRDLLSLVNGLVTTGTPGASTVVPFAYPRYVQATAYVGDRINAPTGELGSTATYQAGYILQTSGTSFNPGAYIDPFANGFSKANVGAIIPINAIPGANLLEVWWFRQNATNSVKNPVNGFDPIYWPAVIGRYSLGWPDNPTNQIVMAGNAGSGALSSLQAKGTIYVQNDPTQVGYNPNEEHALMIGGQAYALRDDLNVTAGTTPAVLSGASVTFSSQPCVLLNYTESDGRPAMRAFKVMRENPALGLVFDYVIEAGQLVQAPMPLPLIPIPLATITNITPTSTNIYVTNYNSETSGSGGDLPVGWASSETNGQFGNYPLFTYRDRKNGFWVMRGTHAGLPALAAGTYSSASNIFNSTITGGGSMNVPSTNYIHTSRRIGSLVFNVSPALPTGITFGALSNGLAIYGTWTTSTSGPYQLSITDGDGSAASVSFSYNSTKGALGPLTILSTNTYTGTTTTFIGRPPHLSQSATNTNSFAMRFYYKTQDGFAWPSDSTPPTNGTIVPYLRPYANGAYSGTGDTNSSTALPIVYRPVWPGTPLSVAFGETLTVANKGRPAIRGQSSAMVIYQQAIATNTARGNNPAVILHDPTRQKSFALKTNANDGLTQLPAGVYAQGYQGKTYFPNLPPHLANRFYLDPNSGPKGSLIYKGEFKDEPTGEKYLQLNVLTGSDLTTIQNLCPATDPDSTKWNTAVSALAVSVDTFYENPAIPGQFIVNPAWNVTRGAADLVAITNKNTPVDSYALSAAGPGQGYFTMIVGNGDAFTPPSEPVSMYVMRVTGELYSGEVKVIPSDNPLSELITFEHTADLAAKTADYEYEWKIAPPVDGFPPVTDATMSRYQALTNGTDIKRYTLGVSGILILSDNWLVMRYRPKNTSHPLYNVWSDWTAPQFAEGYVKRVLDGINPFNQRTSDLANNAVNTGASMLTQAGKRYEGDIALNQDALNSYGLIEIYETVLNRARNLSINAGINYGPANDSLLLAAGYISDLYKILGDEAADDADNPTIGIGTKDHTYGDIATALYSFKGQVPSLLEEELALLQGRDDVALPGVQTAPVYNRLVWNYTGGIDSGQSIYALNYNILDQNSDGAADAADAAILYPQGHGDAYGHYLSSLKGYHSLLMNPYFDWVPRVQSVIVLGLPVTVSYEDERKFASAAASVASTGRKIFDLTWRKYYVPGTATSWDSFSTNRVSTRTVTDGTNVYGGTNVVSIVREWGVDQWASRTGQGALVNWVIGNALLPDVDPDPSHEGIQKVDRTTVPELNELAATAVDLQAAMDNAEGRLSPLGVTQGSIAFDINPAQLIGPVPQTHFEQIYERTKIALNNAVAAFDDAKDITRLMRSEGDSLADVQAQNSQQELTFTNALIELYGTAYPDDMGPGKTYVQDYAGPDLYHYMYVETPELTFPGIVDPTVAKTYRLDVQNFPPGWVSGLQAKAESFDFLQLNDDGNGNDLRSSTNYVEYTLNTHGYFGKPSTWTGKRQSPGQLQQAVSGVINARAALLQALDNSVRAKQSLDGMIRMRSALVQAVAQTDSLTQGLAEADQIINKIEQAADIFGKVQDGIKEASKLAADAASVSLPTSLVAGLSFGGDLTSVGRGLLKGATFAVENSATAIDIARQTIAAARAAQNQADAIGIQYGQVKPIQQTEDNRAAMTQLEQALIEVQKCAYGINQALQNYDDAQRKVDALIAQGNRIQQTREIARKRTAAIIGGFSARDAAFRLFRSEKLERYKTLFDLASRYALLAANAYDYETGLLGTDQGKSFISQIINSRALGVVRNGEPQFAGSNTGDPGISSALAEMKNDFDALKGRLGFNSPDVYTTLASLRTGNLRIMPDTNGLSAWQDYLQQHTMENILDDSDVRRYCQQVDRGDGLPVPGIVISFSTSINPGQNLFGLTSAAGDVAFHRSSFATKINSVGVAFEGYKGMNIPGENYTSDPNLSYLDPQALMATPYVYLIPVGVDTMRSPPLGDTSQLRTWSVDDVAIPLPFNIGGSGFSGKNFYQSADSLTEPLFTIRKHQAFRPVDSASQFSVNPYLGTGLQFSQYANRRLVGRSVWNSQWKLVIPADSLLSDTKEGLSRFIRTVTDIKLNFTTYSYSGN